MPDPLLDASRRHPVSAPDGTVITNVVHLAQVIDHPNIRVGDYSYYNDFEPVEDYAARLAPYLYPGAPERLEIGRFVQIAHGVRIITSSANHPMDGFSTYPFAIFKPETMGVYAGKMRDPRPTIIGHDVWLGHGAVVMPGVTIGHGVIVAAGAVVTRDVPPYSIVGGNPAALIRPRFQPDVVERLIALAWWDRDLVWIKANLDAITGADIDALEAAA